MSGKTEKVNLKDLDIVELAQILESKKKEVEEEITKKAEEIKSLLSVIGKKNVYITSDGIQFDYQPKSTRTRSGNGGKSWKVVINGEEKILSSKDALNMLAERTGLQRLINAVEDIAQGKSISVPRVLRDSAADLRSLGIEIQEI